MKVSHLNILNFRGVKSASLLFSDHVILIGDNNTGKSTILEALDLVLGPDRLSRSNPIDEHDFYLGEYLSPPVAPVNNSNAPDNAPLTPPKEKEPAPSAPQIKITATITGLSDRQRARFVDYLEWWDISKNELFEAEDPKELEKANVTHALCVTFIGEYDPKEDDFIGKTFFTRTLTENPTPEFFGKTDKQKCGFLYLRAIRTGTRALSLERGSLLDIILRIKEIRPKMWEATLAQLEAFDVASDPELGISGVLSSIEQSLKKYVPWEWGMQPHLRVSSLTRRHLRDVITAFIGTGSDGHSAPYYRQGAGTINMLLLAMLSQIAEDKQNVIFAMEEPETAIPPYAQKRIIHELRKLSAQSILTSHSPYVLEEFRLEETIVLCRTDGVLTQASVKLPESVKHKRYKQEFRTRFCEALLARRVLILEGATETSSIPAVARRLNELKPDTYSTLEALGIAVLDAGSDSQIADLATLYNSLGKDTFGLCDKQTTQQQTAIEAVVKKLFMHSEDAFEALVLNNTKQSALERFASSLAWPPHLKTKYPDPKKDVASALSDYFKWSKGNWGLADFLSQCNEDEIPQWIRDVCTELKKLCSPLANASA